MKLKERLRYIALRCGSTSSESLKETTESNHVHLNLELSGVHSDLTERKRK